MLNLPRFLDDAKAFDIVRKLRWPSGVLCPDCGSSQIAQQGFRDQQVHWQHYACLKCKRHFDDLSGTIFEGHPPLRNWLLCLHGMTLNLSDLQIAAELELNIDDVQFMVNQLRGAWW